MSPLAWCSTCVHCSLDAEVVPRDGILSLPTYQFLEREGGANLTGVNKGEADMATSIGLAAGW